MEKKALLILLSTLFLILGTCISTAKASPGVYNVLVAAGVSNGSVYVYVYNGITFSQLWSLNMSKLYGTPPTFSGAPVGVASVAMSTNSTPLYLAAGLYLTDLTLFNAQTSAILWAKSIPISESYGGGWSGTESDSVAISANGQYVVAGCTNCTYVYDTAGALVWSYPVGATCVAISPNGDWVAACNYTNNAIYLFSNPSGTISWTKPITGFWVATSDPGYVVASAYYSNTIYAYNSAGTLMWSYAPDSWTNDFIRVGMSESGENVVAVNDDPSSTHGCTLCYFNIYVPPAPPPVWTWSPTPFNGLNKFWSVAISDDGLTVATGPATTGNTWIFPTLIGPPPTRTFATGFSQSYALTSDGWYGACGTTNSATSPTSGYLYLFNTVTGTLLSSANLGGNVHTVAIAYTLIVPPPSVGGIAVPVGEFGLLGSYVGLVSALTVAAFATAVFVKRVKRGKEKQ